MKVREPIDITTYYIHIGIRYKVDHYTLAHEAINYGEEGEFPEEFPYDFDYDTSHRSTKWVESSVYIVMESIEEPSEELQNAICAKMKTNLEKKNRYNEIDVSVIECGIDSIDKDETSFATDSSLRQAVKPVDLRNNSIQITNDLINSLED